MAEFVMKHLLQEAGINNISVESAALHTDEIGSDIHHGTRKMLLRYSIPFQPRRAWLLTRAKAHEYDLLIGMDRYNIADLKRLVDPADAPKIRSMLSFADRPNEDVADPWYTGDFEETWHDILQSCKGLLRHLTEV